MTAVPLPSDLSVSSTWKDVERLAVALASSAEQNDPISDCLIVSESEWHRSTKLRSSSLLAAYKAELHTVQNQLLKSKDRLKSAMQTRLSRLRVGGKAYPGWVDGVVAQPAGSTSRPGSCVAFDSDCTGLCGMPTLPLMSYCHAHASCETAQSLYRVDAGTGLSMIRVGSAALCKLQKEASQKPRVAPAQPPVTADTTAPNTDKLSLNTQALSPGVKLHTPDRLLAEALSSVAARSEGVSDEQLIRTMTKIQQKRAVLLHRSIAQQQAQEEAQPKEEAQQEGEQSQEGAHQEGAQSKEGAQQEGAQSQEGAQAQEGVQAQEGAQAQEGVQQEGEQESSVGEGA